MRTEYARDVKKMTDNEITRLLAERVMGWVESNLLSDLKVGDDGCLFGNKCDCCGQRYGTLHSRECKYLEMKRIWISPDVERWSDTGEPRYYQRVAGWQPLSRINHAWMVVDEMIKEFYCDLDYESHSGDWCCGFWQDGAGGNEIDENVCRAICKAALRIA